MLRLLLTRRWLGATAVMLVVLAACIGLGIWQYDRAHSRAHLVDVADDQPVPLPDVIANQPTDVLYPVGLLVRGTGHYGTPTTRVDGTVVTPLILDGNDGTVAVVRGEATGRAGTAPAPPVTGDVVVTARMQPPAAAPSALSAAALTAKGYDHRGYLVLTDQEPRDATTLAPVDSPLPPPHRSGLRLQNAFYAVQWWVFGGFAIVFWARFLREDLDEARKDIEPVDAL